MSFVLFVPLTVGQYYDGNRGGPLPDLRTLPPPGQTESGGRHYPQLSSDWNAIGNDGVRFQRVPDRYNLVPADNVGYLPLNMRIQERQDDGVRLWSDSEDDRRQWRPLRAPASRAARKEKNVRRTPRVVKYVADAHGFAVREDLFEPLRQTMAGRRRPRILTASASSPPFSRVVTSAIRVEEEDKRRSGPGQFLPKAMDLKVGK